MEFFSGSPKGEAAMIRMMAMLAVHAATEKQFTVSNFPVAEVKEILDNLKLETPLEPGLPSPGSFVSTSQASLEEAAKQENRGAALLNQRSVSLSHEQLSSPTNAPLRSKTISARGGIDAQSSELIQRLLNKIENIEAKLVVNASDLSVKVVSLFFRPHRVGLDAVFRMLPLNLFPTTSYIPPQDRLDTSTKAGMKQLTDNFTATLDQIVKKLSAIEAAQKHILGGDSSRANNWSEVVDSDDDGQTTAESTPVTTKPKVKIPMSSRAASAISEQASVESLGVSETDIGRHRLSSEGSATSLPTPVNPSPNTPKMFAKLPQEVLNANLAKPELMRLSVVYELIETEADYVRDLNVMINFHKADIQKNKLLSEEDVQVLFSNIEQLVAANQQFLNLISAKRDANPLIEEIGDAFVEISESFKVYTVYCGNYPSAMKLVHSLQANPEFKEHTQRWMNSPEGRGLSLESFLIKPVQRICKYPLLIKELTKHTDKAHKDYASLEAAMEKIEAVVALVNESTRVLGERDKLVALQGRIESPQPLNLIDKKLFKDGILPRVMNGKPKERFVAIFNDSIMVCKLAPKGKIQYQLESLMNLQDLILNKDATAKGVKSVFQFTHTNGDKSGVYIFSCSSDDERTRWVDAFQEAYKTHPETKKAEKRLSADSNLAKRFSDLSRSNSQRKIIPRGMRPESSVFRKTKFGSIRKSGINVADAQSGEGNDNSFYELDVPDVPIEPEMVEVNGQYWKRTPAATGQNYYYNTQTKETTWKLPENYVAIDPQTLKPINTAEEDAEDAGYVDEDGGSTAGGAAAAEEDQSPLLETVTGFSDWRKVDRGDGTVYYFNVVSQESSWYAPGSKEADQTATV
ncbi:Myosin 10A, isoform D [Quaeritorhiza haematococci]|nr:Myosin 10A, isoform D [Quaeritorhiza haematococci]